MLLTKSLVTAFLYAAPAPLPSRCVMQGAVFPRSVMGFKRRRPTPLPHHTAGSFATSLPVTRKHTLLPRRLVAQTADADEATSTAIAQSLRGVLLEWQSQNAKGGIPPAPLSAMPAEIQNAVAAAPLETRLAAYAKLFMICGRQYLSLSEARLLKTARRVLCPTAADAPGRVPPEAVTRVNVAAIKALVAEATRLSDEQRSKQGGWLLFLLRYLVDRADRGTHVAVDEEAVGVYYDIPLEEEKAEVCAAKASKLFADVLSQHLPDRHCGEHMDRAAWQAHLATITAAVRDAFLELEPSADDAIFWLRVRARATLGDMFRRALNAMAVATAVSGNGYGVGSAVTGSDGIAAAGAADPELASGVVAAAREGMSGEELLEAALELSRVVLAYIMQLYDGVRKVTLTTFLAAAVEHLGGCAGGLAGAATVHKDFVQRFVAEALDGRRDMHSTAKFDAALLRRFLSISSTLADELNVEAYGEALGRAVVAAVGTPATAVAAPAAASPAAATAMEKLAALTQGLRLLDEALEIPSGRRHEVRHNALGVYVRQIVHSGAGAGGGDGAGGSDGAGSGAAAAIMAAAAEEVAVCGFLGVPAAELRRVVGEVASRTFGAALEAAMTAPDGGIRVAPLPVERVTALAAAAASAGLGPGAA
ncbi:unnamed protein product, partial [Phaeothamnion confervicola]